MKYTLNGRKVEIDNVRLEDGMPMVDSAWYADTGEDLTTDELIELENSNHEELYEDAYNTMVDRAHDYYSGD